MVCLIIRARHIVVFTPHDERRASKTPAAMMMNVLLNYIMGNAIVTSSEFKSNSVGVYRTVVNSK